MLPGEFVVPETYMEGMIQTEMIIMRDITPVSIF